MVAKSNAERQAEYKARVKADKKNVNYFISAAAYQALADRATATGKTKLETLEDLLLSNNAKTEPEQTWAFSYEDLQEQAKLIERLSTENAQLEAELQIKNKQLQQPQNSLIDIASLDKIQLYQALEAYRQEKNAKPLRCDCLTSAGKPCKKPYETENSLDVMFSVDLCNVHKAKNKK